jgi:phosphonopyruvate decarboxylase
MLAVRDAIDLVLRAHPTALVVSTCGFITRDLHAVADRPEHFYLVGSMGMAAPIGLGIAVATPHRRVVVLDGDGSFAMNLGVLPVIGAHHVDLVHVVLDNGVHESTGGQRTVGLGDPVGVAQSAGYPEAVSITDRTSLAAYRPERTPALIHVRCAFRDAPIGPRVAHTPRALVGRFHVAATAGGPR